MDAPREIELKLQCGGGDLAELARHPFLQTATPEQTALLTSTYYDTPEGDLRAKGLTLRVRRDGEAYVQTVKASAAGVGLFDRSEWEGPVTGEQPDLGATVRNPGAGDPRSGVRSDPAPGLRDGRRAPDPPHRLRRFPHRGRPRPGPDRDAERRYPALGTRTRAAGRITGGSLHPGAGPRRDGAPAPRSREQERARVPPDRRHAAAPEQSGRGPPRAGRQRRHGFSHHRAGLPRAPAAQRGRIPPTPAIRRGCTSCAWPCAACARP